MINIALIWASSNPEKYGNKILLDLVSKGYILYPINPKSKFINDIKVFKNIKELEDSIDIFNFVVPPNITLNILEDNIDFLRNKRIWCQPWSSDVHVENFLKKNKFTNYVTESCIMINKI